MYVCVAVGGPGFLAPMPDQEGTVEYLPELVALVNEEFHERLARHSPEEVCKLERTLGIIGANAGN